jgi:hypothetical protein
MDPERLEALLGEMARPMFVWRRAIGRLRSRLMLSQWGSPQYRGAETQRLNSLEEMDAMIRQYVFHNVRKES